MELYIIDIEFQNSPKTLGVFRIQPGPISDRVEVTVSIVVGVLILAGHVQGDVRPNPFRILTLVPHPVHLESGVLVPVRRQKVHFGIVVGRRAGGVLLGHAY